MIALGSWYLVETLPLLVLVGLQGWFGGLGRTGLVLMLALGVCTASIGLNYWLIFGGLGIPPLGIHGAGLASVAATTGGCIVALLLFFSPGNRARFGTWRNRNLDLRRLARFCRSALARGGAEVLEMSSMVVFTSAIAVIGTAELAANNLVYSLYLTVIMPVIGLGQGITIGVGQAIGAGRIDIARGVTRRAGVVVACVLVPVTLAFGLLPDALMSIYLPADPDAIAGGGERWRHILALGRPLMLLCVPMLFADCAHLVWRFAVQGAGDTRWPLIVLTTLAIFGCAVPALAAARWVPAATWQAWGTTPLFACWSVMAVYLVIVGLLMYWRYRVGPWTTMTLRS
jgi:MATE family multidrug resistance protein